MAAPLRPALLGRRDSAQAIGEERQRALRGHAGIELAHGPGGGIARVDKGFLATGALALVELVEVAAAHIDLAAHLQQRRCALGQAQRNLPDGANGVRHVFAHLAVAARGGLYQAEVFIAQAHGQAVEFGLGQVGDGGCRIVQAQLTAHARIKGLCAAGLGVGFGLNAEHGQRVAHGNQRRQRCAQHALGGRVGADQLRVGALQRLQLGVHAVVLGIGHAGGIQHVVGVRPGVQLRAQLGHFAHHSSGCARLNGCRRGRRVGKQVVGIGHHCRPAQLNRRRARALPAASSRASSWSYSNSRSPTMASSAMVGRGWPSWLHSTPSMALHKASATSRKRP